MDLKDRFDDAVASFKQHPLFSTVVALVFVVALVLAGLAVLSSRSNSSSSSPSTSAPGSQTQRCTKSVDQAKAIMAQYDSTLLDVAGKAQLTQAQTAVRANCPADAVNNFTSTVFEPWSKKQAGLKPTTTTIPGQPPLTAPSETLLPAPPPSTPTGPDSPPMPPPSTTAPAPTESTP